MKKYSLSAEFVRWEGTEESSSHPDSFMYIIELESDEEARVRLDTLIIERMASKPGWNYKLVNSGFVEFLSSNLSDEFVEDQPIVSDTISVTDQDIYLERSPPSVQQVSLADQTNLPEEIHPESLINPSEIPPDPEPEAPPEAG